MNEQQSACLTEAEIRSLCICGELVEGHITDEQIVRVCGITITAVERLLTARETGLRKRIADAILTVGAMPEYAARIALGEAP